MLAVKTQNTRNGNSFKNKSNIRVMGWSSVLRPLARHPSKAYLCRALNTLRPAQHQQCRVQQQRRRRGIRVRSEYLRPVGRRQWRLINAEGLDGAESRVGTPLDGE
jgi:hypothetical protein